MSRLDFRARVLLAALVPAALMAVALAWYFTQTRINDLDEEMHERGFAIARQLAPAAEYGVFSGNAAILQQLTDAAIREADVAGAAIIDAAGATLAASGQPIPAASAAGGLPNKAILLPAPAGVLVFAAPVSRLQAFTEDIFTDNLPANPIARRPLGAVYVSISREALTLRKREVALNASLLTLAGLVIAGLVARRLSRGISHPVLQLAAVVSEIEAGRLEARAAIKTTGVLKLLERGINDMAAALQNARADMEQRIADATRELQHQQERAEQANRIKTQFLAAASHDLRQPLQAIGLFVNTLRLRIKDPETMPVVERIERALASLESVLEALLDISRLDAGVVTPRVEGVSLARVFSALRDTFAADAAQRGLRLRVRESAAWCASDPLLLDRILSNLLANALRYTSHGGVVMGCRRAGDALRIEVWDSGVGIAGDRREDIFREFIQLANPARTRDKGLGLGLAIVERLCRLLGHPISVRSRPGRGSVFAVTVPSTSPGSTPASELPSAPAINLAGKRILLVDDDQDVLAALSDFFSGRRAIPWTAAGSAEAQRMVDERGRPDLIISDYRLGDGPDGITVVSALRARAGTAVPALIITGDVAPRVLRAVADSGLPLVNKPVRPEQLLEAVAEALRTR